ncbi:hypothetical protein LB524_23145 [Mesorhizobium sp. ESP6-5]|uniref:hypothetical protein n=1 Tax=unclassified Mesorhizobium TaxID=325217 RepID=UPI00114F31B5|nr:MULTISPECIES: hypothetical protein [unclassified Mesorhizobium]MBZ9758186.1 hypothetical protein [Mesorhizobium sp. ESP6-5]TPK81039.1 hypothetical protein FJ936_28385 [Mesorhizobium sp. B2-4-13]
MKNSTAIFTTIALGTVLAIGSATASMARGGMGGHGGTGHGHGGSGHSIVTSNGADDSMGMAGDRDTGRGHHSHSDGSGPFWRFGQY